MESLKLLLAGTPQFAAAIFAPLIDAEQFDIVGIYTQPDRPSGRGKKLSCSAVKQLGIDHNIPIFQPLSLKDSSVIDELKAINSGTIDAIIVVAYGQILPMEILNHPRYGCINVHASLLPQWRGAAPIHRCIEAGDAVSGISIMQMDSGLDTGDILSQKSCTIDTQETTLSLHQKLIPLAIEGLQEVLNQLKTNPHPAHQQDATMASYANKISNAEAQIDWNLDARVIDRKVRAFYPQPGAFGLLQNQRCKIGRARCILASDKDLSIAAGTIIEVTPNSINVQCGSNILSIEQLQLPGKRMMACTDVVQGHAKFFKVGNRFD